MSWNPVDCQSTLQEREHRRLSSGCGPDYLYSNASRPVLFEDLLFGYVLEPTTGCAQFFLWSSSLAQQIVQIASLIGLLGKFLTCIQLGSLFDNRENFVIAQVIELGSVFFEDIDEPLWQPDDVDSSLFCTFSTSTNQRLNGWRTNSDNIQDPFLGLRTSTCRESKTAWIDVVLVRCQTSKEVSFDPSN